MRKRKERDRDRDREREIGNLVEHPRSFSQVSGSRTREQSVDISLPSHSVKNHLQLM